MSQFIGSSECIMPSGDFLNSCINFSLDVYYSTDKDVPTMCKFEAECGDGIANILIENIVYLPINTKFTQMSNVAGFLTYGKNILNNALAAENPTLYSDIIDYLENGALLISKEDEEIEPFLLPNCDYPLIEAPNYKVAELKHTFKQNNYECKAPSGSYTESCDVAITRYSSTDNNLKNTELCEINLKCAGLDTINKITSSTVYFNIGEKEVSTTVQKMENCNGAVVIGNLDNQCSGLNDNDIQNIANKKGKTGKFRS